jgi:hypothetical protein
VPDWLDSVSGFVWKVHGLWYDSTLGSIVKETKKKRLRVSEPGRARRRGRPSRTHLASPAFGFPVQNLGSTPQGLRFRVSGFGFRVSIAGFGFRISDFGFRVSASEFRV